MEVNDICQKLSFIFRYKTLSKRKTNEGFIIKSQT